mgnify:CR=1 FL=1
MNVDSYIVAPTNTVLEVMDTINNGAKGIAYICDNNVVKAAVSDGDIRRFILQNGDLNRPIIEIANLQFRFLTNATSEYARSYMQENGITSVPIVDENRKIKSIVFLKGEQSYKKTCLDVPVVIMAGGKGTRLLPYTQVLPKPLIPIGEKTITEHIMDRFGLFGCIDFYLIVNYKRNLMKAYFQDNDYEQNINFVDEYEFLGTGGGLKLLSGRINRTFFMTNCDVIIEYDYADVLNYHKKQKNLLTMICAVKQINIPYGTVSLDEGGNIMSMQEKPTVSMVTNTGFYVIEPEFLNYIPNDTFIHITDVIQKCIDGGLKIGAYTVSERAWLDMGEAHELDKMKIRLGEV